MFGLLKKLFSTRRRELENWEMELLTKTLDYLPNEYHQFKEQIKEGLLQSALVGYGSPGYIGFSLNSEIHDKFYKKAEKSFDITNIKAFDSLSCQYLSYSIHFAYGIIIGYSLESRKKIKIDTSKIDVLNFKKNYVNNSDYDAVCKILNENEIKLLVENDVYIVTLNAKDYYHLKDLEDGDFLGIDTDKNIYKFTHDPFEIIQLDEQLEDLLL